MEKSLIENGTRCEPYGHTSDRHIREDIMEASLLQWDLYGTTSQFDHLDHVHPRRTL